MQFAGNFSWRCMWSENIPGRYSGVSAGTSALLSSTDECRDSTEDQGGTEQPPCQPSSLPPVCPADQLSYLTRVTESFALLQGNDGEMILWKSESFPKNEFCALPICMGWQERRKWNLLTPSYTLTCFSRFYSLWKSSPVFPTPKRMMLVWLHKSLILPMEVSILLLSIHSYHIY